MNAVRSCRLTLTLLPFLLVFSPWAISADPLPGTQPLTWDDDIASRMVAHADRFLLAELGRSVESRAAFWNRDFTSSAAYARSVEPNRRRLSHILGVRDARVEAPEMELVATTTQAALVGRSEQFQVFAVRWPVLPHVWGEGLLLVPSVDRPVANVIAIPDADQTPEMISGLVEGVDGESQFARSLAANGCQVLVPVLISRELKQRGRATMTTREYLYRSAFELGRHLIGYELQKVLAGVDWFAQEPLGKDRPVAVVGWGEGGMLALYAAALDTRIDVACVSGYFEPRESIWQQPIDRNVFGLLEQFGDAEVASLIAPRLLLIETARGPVVTLPSQGGAPAVLASPAREEVQREVQRARDLLAGLQHESCKAIDVGDRAYLTAPSIQQVLSSLEVRALICNLPPWRICVLISTRPFAVSDRHNRSTTRTNGCCARVPMCVRSS